MRKLNLLLAALVFFGVDPAPAAAQDKPLTLIQIRRAISTVSGKAGPEKSALLRKIVSDVKARGVDFPLTGENEKLLRDEGATDEIIESIRRYARTLPGATTENREFENSYGMAFVPIPVGSVKVTNGKPDVQYTLTIDKNFWMGKTEVTQGQWKAVMQNNPSFNQSCGDDCPVEMVSWNDVQEFIKKLNLKARGTYRLPTEIEFEYSMRGGSAGSFFWGDNPNLAGEYAWYKKNSGEITHPVGRKKPNNFGLYDIAGNVIEWCQDQSPSNEQLLRRVRGGSAISETLRSYASANFPQADRATLLGFRLVYESR